MFKGDRLHLLEGLIGSIRLYGGPDSVTRVLLGSLICAGSPNTATGKQSLIPSLACELQSRGIVFGGLG